MDFFVQNLVGENFLVVPLVSLNSRAVHYLFVSKATVTIVVPFGPSSYFWLIISRKFASSIEDYKWFNVKDALEHGRNTNSLLGSNRFTGLVLAVRMKFSSPFHAFG